MEETEVPRSLVSAWHMKLHPLRAQFDSRRKSSFPQIICIKLSVSVNFLKEGDEMLCEIEGMVCKGEGMVC